MLRYFYLITLLVCVEWTFCYNYIDDSLESKLYKSGRHTKKFRKAGHTKNRGTLVRQDFDYDRSPVEFDVASFIQPVEDTVEDEMFPNRNKKRQNNAISNIDFKAINDLNADDVRMKDSGMDYFEMKENNIPESNEKVMFKESVNTNNLDAMNVKFDQEKKSNTLNDVELASPRSPLAHNPEKKCAFRKMKFPFFFHNKTENADKKNKKRRLFNFNTCKGKMKTKSTPQPEELKARDKVKRSYVERFCPSCRRKYIVDLPPVRTKKAAEESADDKEDHVKELDDVQRRIDDVPDFNAPSTKQTTRLQWVL